MTQERWDEEFDVVVVGSGAAGMSAAIAASFGGAKVLLVEKSDRIGGTTAISGGAVWAPLTEQSSQLGHVDSRDKVLTYLRNTVGDSSPVKMQAAFLDSAAPMVDWFEKNTEVRLAARAASPDYYPDREGAAMGGRTLDPVAFDGRLLGDKFKLIRDPMPEFMVLGGMMITMTDAKHLLAVTKSFKAWKEGMKLVLRFFWDRLRGYHRGTRLVLGNALAARLFYTIIKRDIPFWLNAPMTQIHREGLRVTGITVNRDGKPVKIRALSGVVLATGGFPWSEKLRGVHYPKPNELWSLTPKSNSGDGITLSQSVGATIGPMGASPAFWAPISILKKSDGSNQYYPHLVWERSKPGLMAVNSQGERFVNESASYHDFVRAMYSSHANASAFPAFLVCDSPFMERWGMGLALPGGRSRSHLERAGYLHKSGTLEGLEAELQLPKGSLGRSVTRFNEWESKGKDDDFGKGGTEYNRYLGDADHKPNPCLGSIAQGPFYAVKVYAGDIGTAVGISCGENAEALDSNNLPIGGLFVAGNDMHSVMGGEYPGPGITLGPAMTFGWLAGRKLATKRLSAAVA